MDDDHCPCGCELEHRQGHGWVCPHCDGPDVTAADGLRHGRTSTYRKRRCRCAACTEAHRVDSAAARRRAKARKATA